MSEETPEPKLTRMEQLQGDLRNRLASINAQILHWSKQAEDLRIEETEIEEVLRRLDNDPQSEPPV